jgi:hypothetical protein
MFRFKPAIWRDSILFEFPRPVPVLKVQESWDVERFKIPLQDGDRWVGHSRNGVEIALQGQVGSQAGALKLTEEEMFAAIEALRTALHVGPDDDRYAFFLFHDDASSTYRHFRNCSTVRLDYDLSNEKLYTYSAVIHAEDPVLYTTAPGA